MQVDTVLEQVVTIGEAVDLTQHLGHPVDRTNLVRYARLGRMPARKSKGTWLTTREAVRELVISLENETRGRPRAVETEIPQLAIKYTQTPELVNTLGRIQSARKKLRDGQLSPERKAKLWEELTTRSVYHTNHMEGNLLSFQEAEVVMDTYRASNRASPQKANDAAS